MSEEILKFQYTFKFENGNSLEFDIKLDGTTLKLIQNSNPEKNDWALLENNQCDNCNLKSNEHPYCPIALNLLDILPKFNNVYSYENVYVLVKIIERTYSAKVSVQSGLGAMLGIYMVTSGCPIMSKLKPMVRFHLPFASVEDTVFRSVSTYLVGQYFMHHKKEKADWDLTGLKEIYKEIQTVNFGMATRLRSVIQKDANINALIVLDIFAKEMPQTIDESLKSLQYLFE